MQPISKAGMFRPGCMVRAFRRTGEAQGSMAMARITRYLTNEWGIPSGIVVIFEDGMQEQYDFASIHLIDIHKSVVTHFVPWGRR